MELLLVPSWVLVMLVGLNLGILIFWIVRERYLAPLALFLPLAYLATIYSVIDFLSIEEARAWIRFGQCVLFIDLAAILIAHIRLRRGGRKNAP